MFSAFPLYCLVNMSWTWSFSSENNRSWMLTSGEANERPIFLLLQLSLKKNWGFQNILLNKDAYCKQNRSKRTYFNAQTVFAIPSAHNQGNARKQGDRYKRQSGKTKMCKRFRACSLTLPPGLCYLLWRCSSANQLATSHHVFGNRAAHSFSAVGYWSYSCRDWAIYFYQLTLFCWTWFFSSRETESRSVQS